jgi:chlorinating enzyme
MNTTQKPRLNAGQLEQFKREGYLLYHENVLAPEKFAMLKAHFEELLAALPPEKRPEAMDVPHFTDPELFKWLFDDDILDLVEPLLGPDIVLFSSHFICKPKGDGRRVPWHEDSAYWKTMIDPMEVVTIWLAIDPSTTKNGCMYVIPHTHNTGRRGFSDYDPVDPAKNVFSIEITPGQRDESKAIPCILEANECSFHDGRLMHGSPPNTSDQRRCGYTMRYIRSSTRLSPATQEYHQIYLARGHGLPGQAYADPTKQHDDFFKQRIAKGRRGH